VNKRDLVAKIAADAQLTKLQAARALDAFLDGVQAGLLRGDRVTLVGFGTFMVSRRKARVVRDPQRGTKIRIAATSVARFAAGVDLKVALQNTPRAGPVPS